MVRLKGMLSPWAIDHGYPHQVALCSDDAFRARHKEIDDTARALGCSDLGHTVRHDGEWYSVFCFADQESARVFRERFDGVPFNPADKGKGDHWMRWRKLPWNRGVDLREISTDATLLDIGGTDDIYAYCMTCGHLGQIDRADLSDRVGHKARLRAVEKRLRCPKCTMAGHSIFGVAAMQNEESMCNLYNLTGYHEAMRRLFKPIVDLTNRLDPATDVYPDYAAPVVRNNGGDRELAMVRWGMPSSQEALFKAAKTRADKLRAKGKDVDFDQLLKSEPDRGTTNIRNLNSKHWKRWFGVENRCVVPFTSFAEPNRGASGGGRIPNAWFAINEDRPLAAFAGIWLANWTGVRKVRDGVITTDLFGFLTTDANNVVKPIHPNAMPVILTTESEIETWLTAPWEEAKQLQRPLSDDLLTIVDTPKVAA